jgi:hypothetical protein
MDTVRDTVRGSGFRLQVFRPQVFRLKVFRPQRSRPLGFATSRYGAVSKGPAAAFQPLALCGRATELAGDTRRAAVPAFAALRGRLDCRGKLPTGPAENRSRLSGDNTNTPGRGPGYDAPRRELGIGNCEGDQV